MTHSPIRPDHRASRPAPACRHARRGGAALLLAGLLAAAGASAQMTAPDGAAAPRVQHAGNSFHYIHGGGGGEERAALEARAAEFPLKIVLSAGTGEYIVADLLSLLPGSPGETLAVRDAGPLVMIKAPAGNYSLEVMYQGRTHKQPLKVSGARQTVNVRFP